LSWRAADSGTGALAAAGGGAARAVAIGRSSPTPLSGG